MPEFLLELGCEELPAVFVRRAYTDLLENLTVLLGEANVLQSEGTALGTPRRLIISFLDLKDRQEDQTKEMRGPGIKGAYDAEGNPTPALLGFCRGQGVSVGELRRDDQYVWATKAMPGRPTSEILAEAIPKAIRAMTFDKTMRWGASRMRFARPIRWILASFDGAAVNFDIEGVHAGLESRGHRFYAPDTFRATSFNVLIEGLRSRCVEPDPAVRSASIVNLADEVVRQAFGAEGFRPDMSEDLIEENTFLTERPVAILGQFREEFMDLPEAVLVTAMAKHEKMFPIRNAESKLTNSFVFIRNSGEDDTVRRGCEWVLNARFNDAKFFFDEDRKHSMDDFLAKTEGILFQERLGSVRKRADRLADLAESIAKQTGAGSSEQKFARQAGLYAKADLSSGLVSEFSSLQGVIGGAYARREGFFGSIAWAIETQYDISQNTDPGDCAGERASIRLSMADQLDKLAGYLGIGKEPSGSSDPFGLRRATTVLIEAAWMWPGPIPAYEDLFILALGLYEAQGISLDVTAARKALRAVFASRYPSMLPNVRHDILDAALIDPDGSGVTNPRAIRLRSACLAELVRDLSFVQTATRPLNIVASARKKGIEFGTKPFDANKLDSEPAMRLLEALTYNKESIKKAELDEDETEIIQALKSLKDPINSFFDSTMVMAEDPAIREARLSLLDTCTEHLFIAGDFSKIVIEG